MMSANLRIICVFVVYSTSVCRGFIFDDKECDLGFDSNTAGFIVSSSCDTGDFIVRDPLQIHFVNNGSGIRNVCFMTQTLFYPSNVKITEVVNGHKHVLTDTYGEACTTPSRTSAISLTLERKSTERDVELSYWYRKCDGYHIFNCFGIS